MTFWDREHARRRAAKRARLSHLWHAYGVPVLCAVAIVAISYPIIVVALLISNN